MTSNPSPVVRGKPRPEDWPMFILDVDKWTIGLFADIEKSIWLDKNGVWDYGVISYAWGIWHNKEEWHQSSEKDYPQFDEKIPKSDRWSFPAVNKGDPKPPAPIFTIQEVQKTLRALKKKYVWWDWACNVQGKEADLLKNKRLLAIQSVEVNKMRTVYSYASTGCLWLHQGTWASDTQRTSDPVQVLLDLVTKMRIEGQSQLTVDTVARLHSSLIEAKNKYASFTSVWSFQEGICLHSLDRKVDTKSTCTIYDHNANPYTAPGTPGNNDGVTTGDYVNDISNVVSLIAMGITDVLERKAQSLDPEPNTSQFLRDCYKDELIARDFLCKLIATGFSSYRSDNPVGLLESKWARTLKAYNCEADKTARGLIGALDIQIDPEILKQAAEQKAQAKTQDLANEAECKVLKPAFLEALLATYSWRMLLHARGKDTFTPPPFFQQTAWWNQFVGLPRPQFAALDLYIGETQLARVYQPHRDPTQQKPSGAFDLPDLRLSSQTKWQLVAKAKPAYKFYNFSTVKPASAWSACQFYEYVKMVPDNTTPDQLKMLGDRPGTIAFAQLNPTELTKANGKLGDKVVLLPFEKITAQVLDASKKLVDQARIRCFVLSDFEDKQNPRNATFRGVADFAGLSEASMIPFDKDLQIW